ncbi:MAG: prepilin-type N-terminal cleavage/methylation domain-containing protein [Kiritimatiellae bacterium]|nr:prepilin-type N-terminal cleavage/methylation domain-containing protein [Kiritimatiellia bacterium]
MKKGFTLVEMLVVLGIIAVLVGATIGGYSKFSKTAEKTRCQELVSNTATALATLFQQNGAWPRALRTAAQGDGKLTATAAYPLAAYMSLTTSNNALAGYDRLGIVSPWATAVIRHRSGGAVSESTRVPSGGTVDDHILRFAIDYDGDGIIEGANVGGETIDIRATAAVWCCGKDGRIEAYSQGLRRDDVYSWTKGQTQNVR